MLGTPGVRWSTKHSRPMVEISWLDLRHALREESAAGLDETGEES